MAMAVVSLPEMGATTLVPEQCSIGDRPFVHPLEHVEFTFDGEIQLGSAPSAMVFGEEWVSAKSFEVSNYKGKERTQGTLIVWFDKQNLPLGQDYKLTVSKGTVSLVEDNSTVNDAIEVNFSVPADLGPHRFDYEQNAVIESAQHIWVYWGFETAPVRDPQFELYHDGNLIGVYPAHVGWDWDLGQAYVDFLGTMRFERDEHYSLVLPAGSVKSCYRDDLLNREARLDFIGGADPVEPDPLWYDWCSIFTEHPSVYNIIWFQYNDMSIRVADDAKIQLYDSTNNILVAEADAWHDTMVNCVRMNADFGGFELEDGIGYTLVVPAGTVYREESDGTRTYNKRQGLNVSDPSGVDNRTTDSPAAAQPLHDLNGNQVSNPIPGTIYIRAGKKIIWH